MTIDTVEHVAVLIAGAGPVRLTLPLELEHHGVDALLVGRNTTTTRHPKMDITNGRSMELFRRLGVADCLRKLALPADHPSSQPRHAAAGAQHAGLTDPARAASAAGVTSSGPQGFSGDRTLTLSAEGGAVAPGRGRHARPHAVVGDCTMIGGCTMIRRTLVLAISSVALGVLGCSSAGQSQVPSTSATQEDLGRAELPPPLAVPAGNRLTSSLDGSGVQVYQCAKGGWTLLQPAATLTAGGKPVGLHFKGPVWVSTVDGSEVGAAPVATVNRDGAIPELLLKANQNQGQGMFSKVTYVQRLRTTGGVAPAGSCTEGSQQAIQYSAVYRFWSAAP